MDSGDAECRHADSMLFIQHFHRDGNELMKVIYAQPCCL